MTHAQTILGGVKAAKMMLRLVIIQWQVIGPTHPQIHSKWMPLFQDKAVETVSLRKGHVEGRDGSKHCTK